MITREDLYQLIWSQPMTKIAKQLGISDSYLSRICVSLRIPRPGLGYWTKLSFGNAPAPIPLPEAQPGDQLAWHKEGGLRNAAVLSTHHSVATRDANQLKHVDGIHPLISFARVHFESGRPVKDEDYLKPNKKLLPDITASKSGLEKTLQFASDLYNAFENAGHRVVISPSNEQVQRATIDEHETPVNRQRYDNLWHPYRPTFVYIGNVPVGLAIIEMSEAVELRYVNGKYIRESEYVAQKLSRHNNRVTWTSIQDRPCGRLRLMAYSPHWRTSWSQCWQESKGKELTRAIKTIVRSIETSASELVGKIEEANHQAEIEHQERLVQQAKRRQEEIQRRVQQSIKESSDQLLHVIESWSRMRHIEQFLAGVEDVAKGMSLEDQIPILEKLKLARRFLGTQNPMDFFMNWKTPSERYQPDSPPTSM